jgi:hypothetical protein
MIISRGRKYIFVHIPKTGGTSMALALEDRAMADDIMFGDTPKAMKRRRKARAFQARGRLWKHSTLQDIEGVVTAQEMDEMFVFTMVRNPWDRMVSYYHWLKTQNFDHPFVHLAKSSDFGTFIMDANMSHATKMSPAESYVTRRDGQVCGDLFIRLEHLQEDCTALEAHLGFELTLPQANASRRDEAYQHYYTPTTRDHVAQICARDIAQFGYTFDEATPPRYGP